MKLSSTRKHDMRYWKNSVWGKMIVSIGPGDSPLLSYYRNLMFLDSDSKVHVCNPIFYYYNPNIILLVAGPVSVQLNKDGLAFRYFGS